MSSGLDLGTCPAGGTRVAPGRCRVAQMFLLGLGTGSDAEGHIAFGVCRLGRKEVSSHNFWEMRPVSAGN